MYREEDRPEVGAQRNQLGVRIDPPSEADVHPEPYPDGEVTQGKGMSVAPHWKDLRPFLIPKRLRGIVADARGSNDLVIWRHGEGRFHASRITENLALGSVTSKHGQVEPTHTMPVATFQDALAATSGDWQRDEEE
jgi:hypothetical protein